MLERAPSTMTSANNSGAMYTTQSEATEMPMASSAASAAAPMASRTLADTEESLLRKAIESTPSCSMVSDASNPNPPVSEANRACGVGVRTL